MITVFPSKPKVGTKVILINLMACYVTGKFIQTNNHISVVLDLLIIFAQIQSVKQKYITGRVMQEIVNQLIGPSLKREKQIAIR